MDKKQSVYLHKNFKRQSLALRASSSIDKAFRNSAFYKFFRSYYKTEEKFTDGFFSNIFGFQKLGTWIKIFKNSFAKSCENSFTINIVKNFYEKLLLCSIRNYAVIMLYFGVYALSISAIKSSFYGTGFLTSDNAYISMLLIIMSFVFMPIKDSFAEFSSRSQILSFLLKNLLFTPNLERLKKEKAYSPSNGLLIISGTVLGVMTYFVQIKTILLITTALLLVMLMLKTPENALPFLIIACPFCSPSVLFLLCTLAFAAYMFKVMRGKRNLSLNYFDTLMLFAAVILFLGGFGTFSGNKYYIGTLLAISSIAVYFLIRNCLKNEAGFRKCIYALALCAAAAAFTIVYKEVNLRGFNGINFFDRRYADFLPAPLFDSRTASGEFLLLLLPFSVLSLIISKTNSGKAFSVITIALCSAALILTGSKGILLAFSMCILVYITASFHNQIASLLTIFIVGAVLSLFITNSAFLGNDRFFNVNNYKESILVATSEITSDNLAAGIGLGKENFSGIFRAYTNYSENNISSCYNLYLQLLAQVGIFGFIYFMCMSVCYFKMQFSCLSENRVKNFFTAVISITAISSVVTVFLRGLTSYVFNDYRVFFMFIVIIAVSSAAYCSAKSSKIYYNEG